MVSSFFDSQFILWTLVWLVVMLHLIWLQRMVPAPAAPAAPAPLPSTPHRSQAPKPFEGLIHKPHCALCEHDTVPPHVPPASLAPTSRRPRAVDTSRHFCPHTVKRVMVSFTYMRSEADCV
jgi:hypothetical protein